MLAYKNKLVNSLGRLKNGKILILGFGREGQDTLLFLRKFFPGAGIGIADQSTDIENPESKDKKYGKITWHLGKNYLKAIKRYDIVIKSPGIPPKAISRFATERQKITSQTEIFFDLCHGKVIGVTGTKGKSTTTAMIFEVLREAGLPVRLVGNIGKPALSALLRAGPNDIFAYELSSHQLYGMRRSPHVAVFLDIYPEHLDYYKSFQEYARAKANVCLWQNKEDYLVFNSGDILVRNFAKKSKAKKIPIQGKYYELDKAAALAVAKIFDIPRKKTERTLKNFAYLPHRLELVGTFRGVTFYNDSLATIPQAVIAAMNSLGPRVETLIAGGFDRGVDFKILSDEILKSNIKTLILFPPSGKRILKAVMERKGAGDFVKCFPVKDMPEAVRLAFLHTKRRKICLLSPASPSFGLFRDYRDRGDAYKKAIRILARRM